MEKLIIVGLDPGTTKGYAVLDINGNVLELKSSKKLDLNSVTREVFSFGKPILVGTDVNKAPNFVEKFASSLGAKLAVPEFNIQSKHKKVIVKRFLKNKKLIIKNKHEGDALISAILAYKSIKPLLKKIEDRYKDKTNIIEDIKNLVLKEHINIKKAESLLED